MKNELMFGMRSGKTSASKLHFGCDFGSDDVTVVSAFEKTEQGFNLLGSVILEKTVTEDAEFEIIESKQLLFK